MPKRKPDQSSVTPSISITSLDAALDILACETFTRLRHLSRKFEVAAGIKLNDGVVQARWDEAVRRYWVMKGMDDLCCTSRPMGVQAAEREVEGEIKMEDDRGECGSNAGRTASGGRPLPSNVHPGAPIIHSLNAEEELEWRRWTPRTGDSVLVELQEGTIWPGKIIDKKVFFQGRTQPRGNHFFAVRLYDENLLPTVTIKSRLLPLHLRPEPPLLASTTLLSAFNHASNPSSFDMRASARESLAAHNRTHPGIGLESDSGKIKAEKVAWNDLMNWVMSERRIEKLRVVEEERSKRLREVTKLDVMEGVGEANCPGVQDGCAKKRRTDLPLPLTEPLDSQSISIFGTVEPTKSSSHSSSPSIAGIIRPALSTPQRPNSPRRLPDRKRSVYTGVGDYSPRGRGGTYTPPRILPSGDETAPSATGSPAPSLQIFDFVSPLGPVRSGRLEKPSPILGRKGSLEVVKEEPQEEGDGWTIVQSRRSKRAGSLPCREKAQEMIPEGKNADGMTVDA